MNTDTAFDSVEAGRRLGHDLYRYRRPLDLAPRGADATGRAARPPHAVASLHEGFAEARQRHVPTHLPDRHERKWLQLRVNAHRRGRAVADDVTPATLACIDVADCPVLRTPLTHGTLAGTDASVDRLNNDGAYARNNLAVMSARANRAKGDLGFAQVHAFSLRAGPTAGLAPAEWGRMAALMLGPCFVETPAAAPMIPLTAPLSRYAAHPAAQQIQHVFTTTAGRAAGKNLLTKALRPACASERAQHRLQRLVDAVHCGLKRVEVGHDVWLEAGLMDRFVDWREALGEPAWALAGEIAGQLSGARRVPTSRLAAWHLPTRGRAT